ncbi:hypothetical protein TUBRATIS_24260 [Tubulinosema ratisbonensis]|uniref:Uncharacterized protein n=1 Tax=Tubulinosema ratisbonensis TaxID=291195 RepID=A0A437AJ55_9MICR|nr:hypothetical protein TUBRATIS_24260 [Tubulinosema ratisbonensis]
MVFITQKILILIVFRILHLKAPIIEKDDELSSTCSDSIEVLAVQTEADIINSISHISENISESSEDSSKEKDCLNEYVEVCTFCMKELTECLHNHTNFEDKINSSDQEINILDSTIDLGASSSNKTTAISKPILSNKSSYESVHIDKSNSDYDN